MTVHFRSHWAPLQWHCHNDRSFPAPGTHPTLNHLRSVRPQKLSFPLEMGLVLLDLPPRRTNPNPLAPKTEMASALHCIAEYRNAFHCVALNCNAMHCILHRNALHCIALRCIALHYNALHGNVLYCIWQVDCIAEHRNAFHCVALHCNAMHCILHCNALHCAALHRIALQCIAL